MAEKNNGGNQDDDVAGEGKEHRLDGLFYGLEEDGGGLGQTTEGDATEVDAEGGDGVVFVEGKVGGVAAEETDERERKELKEYKSDKTDNEVAKKNIF